MLPWETAGESTTPPAPPPVDDGKTTKLFSPEGELAEVPTENVDKALQQKFRYPVHMTSPEGQLALMHPSKAGAAISQGFKVGPPEQQPAGATYLPKVVNAPPDPYSGMSSTDPRRPIDYAHPHFGDTEGGSTPGDLLTQGLQASHDKLVQKGGEVGSKVGTFVANQAVNPGNVVPDEKLPPWQQNVRKTVRGVGGGVGHFVGGTAADPYTYALLLGGGPEGKLAKSALTTAFGAQAAKSAYDTAGSLGELWDDDSVPLEDKVAQGTESVMSTLTAAGMLKHAGKVALTRTSPLLEGVPEADRDALVTSVNRRLSLKDKAVSTIAGGAHAEVPLEPAAGPLSHAEVADFAAKKGVELTPAQASQSKPLQGIQAVGERALVGGKPLQDLLTRQKGQVAGAVQDFTQRTGNEYTPDAEAVGEHLKSQAAGRLEKLKAPLDDKLANLQTTAADLENPEDVGTHLRNQAKNQVAQLKGKAAQDYETWRQGTNGLPFDVDLSDVADKYQRQLTDQAEALKNTPAAYAAPIKELLQKVADVRSDLPQPEASPVVRNATAQSMRSAYLDIARDQSGNIPSRVQSLARQVASDLSDAMGASATKAGVADAWHQANQTYRHLMETYQDSDSPLAKLLAEEDPTKITAQVLAKNRFGGNAQTLQLLQREGYDLSGVKGQVLRELQTKGGDLQKLGYGDDFLRQLFTPDELRTVKEVAQGYRDLAQHPLQKVASGDAVAVTGRLTAKGRFGGNSRVIRDLASQGVDLSPVRQQVLQEITQQNFKLTNGGHGLGGYQLPYLKELFEPHDLDELLALGRVVRATKFELNPSGTSNVMTAARQLAGAKSPSLAGGVAGLALGGPVGGLLGATGTEVVAPALAAKFSAEPRNVARALNRAPNPLVDRPELPAFMRTAALTGQNVPNVTAGADRPVNLDRRQNLAERKRVAEMTPDERAQELLTSDKTGLPNQRAFDEDAQEFGQSHPHVGYADIDDFKRFNTVFGHQAVDQAILPTVGDLFRDALAQEPDVKAYHRSGDEFNLRAKDPAAITRVINQVNQQLADTTFTYEKPDGTVVEKKGTGLSHGIALDHEAAELAADTDKQARKVAGLRSGDRDLPTVGTPGADGEQAPGNQASEWENIQDVNNPRVREELLAGKKQFTARATDEPINEDNPVWYSRLERTIEAKLPNKFTADQALNTLRNAGVSADELATLDLKPGAKLTKTEVLAKAHQQGLKSQVQDVWKQGEHQGPTNEDLDEFALERYGRKFNELNVHEQVRIEDAITGSGLYDATNNETKYAEHVLPGGENYRELLLQKHLAPTEQGEKLPSMDELSKTAWADLPEHVRKELASVGGRGYDNLNTEKKWNKAEQDDRQSSLYNISLENTGTHVFPESVYRSSHWDEPNVLGHLRMNDRTDVNGKKTLFLEELQSDWHQQGRKEGYQTQDVQSLKDTFDEASIALHNFESDHNFKFPGSTSEATAKHKLGEGSEFDKWSTLYNAANEAEKALIIGDKVPDAPFKKDWHELLLKRALREAVDSGADQLAWTPGDVQNERYDLSKHIDVLNWTKQNDGTFAFTGYKDGKSIINQSSIPLTKLPDYVGKDVTQKIVDKANQTGESGRAGQLSGLDLRVGGAGMRGFYDKLVPDFLNKFGKRYGARVGSTEVPTGEGWNIIVDGKVHVAGPFQTREAAQQNLDQFIKNGAWKKDEVDIQPVKPVTVPMLSITPKMRQDILKGLPISDLKQPHHPDNGQFLPWQRAVTQPSERAV